MTNPIDLTVGAARLWLRAAVFTVKAAAIPVELSVRVAGAVWDRARPTEPTPPPEPTPEPEPEPTEKQRQRAARREPTRGQASRQRRARAEREQAAAQPTDEL